MKRVLVLILLGLFCVCGLALAGEETFEPIPYNLYDLDHGYYYSWGIDWQIPDNEVLTSAILSFDNINNWAIEPDDKLYVNLLNSATPGVFFNIDGQAIGNAFNGSGSELFIYTDTDESVPDNIAYNFNGAQLSLLNGALADGNFGLGFDPDCHYFNNGINLKLTTSVVPEPISCVLFLLGAGALAGAKKLRKS